MRSAVGLCCCAAPAAEGVGFAVDVDVAVSVVGLGGFRAFREEGAEVWYLVVIRVCGGGVSFGVLGLRFGGGGGGGRFEV